MGYRQGGFTLVEMMVAMLLGIMILLAVSEVFVNNNRTRIEIENTTRQIENGRYAMQLLEGELANAGFFGEASTVGFPTPLPPACVSSSAEVEDSLGVPVYGGATVSSGADCRGGNVKAENDYLAIRRSSTCAVGSAGCDSFLAGAYHLRVSACHSNNPGDPVPGTVTPPATSESALDAAKARNCSDPAPTYRYLNRLYYIRGDDVLMRAELGAGEYANTPLVDGIERLRFSYGLDNVGSDGQVDEFVDEPTDAQWADVIAVRIWLLARNLDPTPNYIDERTYDLGAGETYSAASDGFEPRFKRHLYTSTVRLNNVAGRRESPVVAGATGEEEDTPADEQSTETPSEPAI